MQLSNILRNIKNLIPYFLLIAVYFSFVNIEANKDINKNKGKEKEKILSDDEPKVVDKQLRIRIPVIPYEK